MEEEDTVQSAMTMPATRDTTVSYQQEMLEESLQFEKKNHYRTWYRFG